MKKSVLLGVILLAAAALTVATHHLAFSERAVRVRVTTTTSLYATGLLDYLADEFKKAHPSVELDFIAVGSGEALRRAEQGDACMVFVHAPSLEKEYIEKGIIEGGRIFAYNFFVIVGPASDPAGVREARTAVEAFQRIYSAGERGAAKFVSRGDVSGTHVRELSIWKLAGLKPQGRSWYLETGQGMAQTLVVASEMSAYTLSDIGTYLELRKEGRIPNLVVLYGNGTELVNVYSVYLVSSCRGEERRAAEEFADFVYTHQDLVASYGVDDFGQPLFYPARGREAELHKAWEELAKG
ncbi:MAG: substrate-binding domain-containing protein [Thermoproteota archaeon]